MGRCPLLLFVLLELQLCFFTCPSSSQRADSHIATRPALTHLDVTSSANPSRELQAEADALLRFRRQIQQDPTELFTNWGTSSNGAADPCLWLGIQCSADNAHVQSISLSSRGLAGSLVFSTWLPSLPMLQTLDLSGNALAGNLSSIQPGSCGSLQRLDLAANQLSGSLPGTLISGCGKIAYLNLSGNTIKGSIPEHFLTSSCGALQTLDLSGNQISGALPAGAGFCSTLLHLRLAKNLLNDSLPLTLLSNCSAGCATGPPILSLDLSKNRIPGSIPDQFFANCGNMVAVDLSSNLLTGLLPSSLQACKKMTTFNVIDNRLSSELPEFLGKMESIQQLYLASNQFFGSISPRMMGGLCRTIQELNLSHNNLTGTLPSSFTECNPLQSLRLENNNFSGDFPSNVFSPLQELEILSAGFNKFTGLVPLALMNCSKLKVMDFGGNQLAGYIPPEMCVPSGGIGSHVLEQILLPNNQLFGRLPSSLMNCTNLVILNLSFNKLTGAIPLELGFLANLEHISLWYNQLSGSIPPQLGNLVKLRSLNLNNNLLSSKIPVSLARCTSLEWLNLNSNQLTGRIPHEFSLLQNLILLELGNNSLTGGIPPELGNCSQLLWLDLNTNYLTGPIPPAIGRHASTSLAQSVLAGNQLAYVRNPLMSACKGFGMGIMVDFTGIMQEDLLSTTFTSCQAKLLVYTDGVLYDNPENRTLQYLDLSFNQFSGSIPTEMGSWVSLISLALSHNQLTGELPASFANLRALNVLDISHNELEGSLSVLASCTFLVAADVSNNHFSGEIPLGQLSTNPPASFANNSRLCGPPLSSCNGTGLPLPDSECNPKCSGRSRLNLRSMASSIVLAILVALLCACALVVWIGYMVKNKSRKTENALLVRLQQSSCNGSSSWNLSGEREPLSINVATFERPLRKLTFSQLIEATDGFSRESLIGTGGFGEVYKADLKDGTVVAIKKLLQFSMQGDREFFAEMETLGKIKHRNLVPLLGYCKVGEERLLVYEYMHGGSLEEVLHGSSQLGRESLNWDMRKQIAKGAARGLAFLHHNCIPHIIHRDMKSSNVLLDKDFEARVSDFGMARLISALDTHLSVSTLAGTPGYVPPEYYQSFRCTTKGDIYSFGVILLELVTGKRPTDKDEFGDNNLVGWVKLQVAGNNSLEVLDPILRGTGIDYEMVQYLKVACDCLDDVPSRRPTMLHVIDMLKELGFEEQSASTF